MPPGLQKMRVMARHRSYSLEFKRQIAMEYIGGESLHGLAKRHDISRNLIRMWIAKYEAGEFGDDAKVPSFFRSTRRRSPRSSGWSDARLSRSSF